MKSFNEYINFEKETGFLKQTSVKGSGGKGGFSEPTKGDRAMIKWVDGKGQKWSTLIPPMQYHPAKNNNKLKNYVKQFTDDVKKKGGKVKKVNMKT